MKSVDSFCISARDSAEAEHLFNLVVKLSLCIIV